VERVSVIGNSGSGKTTVASSLAARLGIRHIELDAVFHQPGWSRLPVPEFRHRVAEAVTHDAWVMDGNYSVVLDLVWGRADTVVWLDLPRRVLMRRLVIRTLSRLVRRTELWNGNRERWRDLASLDPDRSLLAWAWTQHAPYRRRYEEAMANPALAHLHFARLRTAGEIEAFLRAAREG
jgi:adenylate kinase family enzyme